MHASCTSRAKYDGKFQSSGRTVTILGEDIQIALILSHEDEPNIATNIESSRALPISGSLSFISDADILPSLSSIIWEGIIFRVQNSKVLCRLFCVVSSAKCKMSGTHLCPSGTHFALFKSLSIFALFNETLLVWKKIEESWIDLWRF